MTTHYYYIADRMFPHAPITPAWITGIRNYAAMQANCDALIIYHVCNHPDTSQLRLVLDYAAETPESSLVRYHRFLQAVAPFFNATLPNKSLNLIREDSILGRTHAVGTTIVLDLALDHYENALFSADGNCYGATKTVVVQLNDLHKNAEQAWQSIVNTYLA